jgi:hypothetical protein
MYFISGSLRCFMDGSTRSVRNVHKFVIVNLEDHDG